MMIFCTQKSYIKNVQQDAIRGLLKEFRRQQEIQEHVNEIVKKENKRRKS